MLMGAERSSDLLRSIMTRAELRGMCRNWREGQSLQYQKEAGRSHCPRWPLSVLTARAPDPRCAERGSREVSVQSGRITLGGSGRRDIIILLIIF